MKIFRFWLLAICLLLAFARQSYAQKTYEQLTNAEKKLYDEHVAGGQPDGHTPVFVRHGYVVKYNSKYRIPDWSAYHVKPEYLKTPKREGRFLTFRKDPDIDNAVVTEDYTGSGYARGHMAPYFVMGGDRNKNGKYSNSLVDEEDPYDDETVFQANYMSNIAPQSQEALNGAGGPWYALETAIRKKLVGKKKMELNVFAGSIILNGDEYYVMVNKDGETDIAVPDEFYQVLIYWDKANKKYITAAFLFPHVDDREELPYDDLLDYLVTVDKIEEITGLDFLNALDVEEQKEIEGESHVEFWKEVME